MLRLFRKLGVLALGLAIVAFAGYRLLMLYTGWREATAPSTQQVLVTAEGQQIPLVQPTAAPAGPANALSAGPARPLPAIPGGLAADLEPGLVAQPAALHPSLPPEGLTIPAIGLDAPVVLAPADNLPQFPGVGWLMGSAFPGAPGNLVLLGHGGGPYATLERLPELPVGAVFTVRTAGTQYSYKVRKAYETDPGDVAVLAPSDRPTATLITCVGAWDVTSKSNARRYIVVADLVEAAPLPPARDSR